MEYSKIEDFGLDRVTFIDAALINNSVEPDAFVQNYFEKLALSKVVAVPVDHIPFSYAFLVEDLNGVRVAFSGDCRPSQLLSQEAEDVDLLIHEATFDDEKLKEASDKKHSTISEALSVAKEYILINYFLNFY
jgi:ribonuclease Z